MIKINNIFMRYPQPRRFREYATKLFKKRDYFTAVSNVDMEIAPGERIAFLGPNGAGKTTLLKLIGGLLLPSEGDIVIYGKNTYHHNDYARKTVGIVMNEERSFYWRLSGYENLNFFGVLENIPAKTLKKRIYALVEKVGLSESIHRRVGQYSSGMKQRLTIARGLLKEPKLLILDEPTRTLDPEAAEDVLSMIGNTVRKTEGMTLLIATHRLEVAQQLCTRVCIINHGKIIADMDIESILRDHSSLKSFYLENINSE